MTRLARYEDATDRWLIALALGFLVVYAVPILDPRAPAWVLTVCSLTSAALWAGFAGDLLVRVSLAEHRLRYLLTHPIDVLAVALPMFRPFRVLRVLAAGQVLFSRGQRFDLGRAIRAVTLATTLLVGVAALAMLDAERSAPTANIRSIGDALWWACTTVTTVGYGDRYPVTAAGRIIAVALMVAGISLVGVITASVASWFMSQAEQVRELEVDLVQEIRQLRAHVEALTRQETGPHMSDGT